MMIKSKYILCYIFILFLNGCDFICCDPSVSLFAPKITKAKNLNLDWQYEWYRYIMTASKDNFKVNINLLFPLKLNKNDNKNLFTINISFYTDNVNYSKIKIKDLGEFFYDTSKVFLKKNNKIFNLKEVEKNYDFSENKTIYNYNKYPIKDKNSNFSNNKFYFLLPFNGLELDNSIIRIEGIYKNGVELPAIEFKINYIKYKKVCKNNI